MSSFTDLPSVEQQDDDIVWLPTHLESDEPPLEGDLHLLIIRTLLDCLEWWWRDRTDFYASGNLTIYYNPQKLKNRDFRGPDFFVVLNVDRHPRKSWTVWEEGGKYPNLIVEVLSNSTTTVDKGLKKQLYQDTFRTPEYFWFDPESLEFQGFQLIAGQYQLIQPTEQGWLWSQQLQLFLGVKEGKVRFFTAEGSLITTPQEAADQERQAKESALQEVERLAAKLRALGIDPDL